jgi:hypothetical protein
VARQRLTPLGEKKQWRQRVGPCAAKFLPAAADHCPLESP